MTAVGGRRVAVGAPQARPRRVRVLGLPVDRGTMDDAVAFVARAVGEPRLTRMVVTNANKSWQATRNTRLRRILEAADFVVPEWATAWAAARLGIEGVHHIGGLTLMVRLLEEAEHRGWSVYFLGAKPEVVEALADRMRRERPELRLAGWHHGYLDDELRKRVRRELAETRPDLLFVAMGSPLQEYVLDALPDDAGPRVGMGVGGSFDVLAGLKKDAPAWARGRGLEWLYRLAQDPRRLWRRYLITNPWFVASVYRERWLGNDRRSPTADRRSVAVAEGPRSPRTVGDDAGPSPREPSAATNGSGPRSAVGSQAPLRAALALDAWMRGRDYAGYDPHDFLNSPLLRALSFRSRWLGVAWTQLGKRCPVQLRPLLGVPRVRNAKGMGLVLASYVRLARATGDDVYRERARELVDWLASHTAPGVAGAGWGYPFPWANRAFFAPAGTPSSVVTAFVGHALLDAAEAFGMDDAATLAADGGEFLLRDLNRIPGPEGTFCFSYTPLDRRAVHNASLLAASLLARLADATGRDEMADAALRAARFTARAQRPDGAWPYGVSGRDDWVDSFHTSYNLVALDGIRSALGTDAFDDVIDRGLDYWQRTFLQGPAVRFTDRSAYPIDLHAVAHTVLALLAFEDEIPGARERAVALVDWSIREMRDPAGFFYYQKHRFHRNRLAYMRWTQAWMLRALAEVVALEGRHDRGRRATDRGGPS